MVIELCIAPHSFGNTLVLVSQYSWKRVQNARRQTGALLLIQLKNVFFNVRNGSRHKILGTLKSLRRSVYRGVPS